MRQFTPSGAGPLRISYGSIAPSPCNPPDTQKEWTRKLGHLIRVAARLSDEWEPRETEFHKTQTKPTPGTRRITSMARGMRAILRRSIALLLIWITLLVQADLGAQSPLSPPPCAVCINGICYSPAPTPTMEVDQVPFGPPLLTFRVLHGVTFTFSSEVQQLSVPVGEYPAMPMWDAWTCPNRVPITLYGSPGLPIAPPPYPLPGIPTSPITSGGTYPPPPAGLGGSHVFWCYGNALAPYGPCTTPGAGGNPNSGPFPQIAPGGSTPVTPSQSPPALGPVPPPWPPVPFGVDAAGMLRVVHDSGCYAPVPNPAPTVSPGTTPTGTLIVIYACHPDGSAEITHACLSNGDGTINSKNGTTPHTPTIQWETLVNQYGTPGRDMPVGTIMKYRCYRRTCQ